MKTYRVLVYGRNFHFAHIENSREVVKATGFYTTRFVTAKDPTAAEYEAMAAIRADQKLRSTMRNPRTDPPLMVAGEIEEVPSIPVGPPPGYCFFTGEGAGRPGEVSLAAFPDDAPEDVKRAAIRRYGEGAEPDPPERGNEVE